MSAPRLWTFVYSINLKIRHKFVRNLFTFFKLGKIMLSKYGNLMLPRVFSDKAIPDIDFTDEAVVQCDVPVIKILLYVPVI